MPPLVSIIVPTYNSAKTLAQTLESVKKQAYNTIEVIIVDNNSTDQTKAIARRFTDKVFDIYPVKSRAHADATPPRFNRGQPPISPTSPLTNSMPPCLALVPSAPPKSISASRTPKENTYIR